MIKTAEIHQRRLEAMRYELALLNATISDFVRLAEKSRARSRREGIAKESSGGAGFRLSHELHRRSGQQLGKSSHN